MNIRAELHAVIRFYVRLGKSLGETYADMKKAYDSECSSKMTVNLWLNRTVMAEISSDQVRVSDGRLIAINRLF